MARALALTPFAAIAAFSVLLTILTIAALESLEPAADEVAKGRG